MEVKNLYLELEDLLKNYEIAKEFCKCRDKSTKKEKKRSIKQMYFITLKLCNLFEQKTKTLNISDLDSKTIYLIQKISKIIFDFIYIEQDKKFIKDCNSITRPIPNYIRGCSDFYSGVPKECFVDSTKVENKKYPCTTFVVKYGVEESSNITVDWNERTITFD